MELSPAAWAFMASGALFVVMGLALLVYAVVRRRT